MVNDLIAISLLQFDMGILASFVIVQMTVHLCITIQKMMHLLHIRHRVEDNMILTTTYAENYGREEIYDRHLFDFIDVHRLDCNQRLLLNVVKPLIRKYFYF